MRRLGSHDCRKIWGLCLAEPLGAGGMGAVYLGCRATVRWKPCCVVKRLLPALLSQPEATICNFRHEADLGARLVHGNRATRTILEVDGEVFLVQEFVEGHDVSALLEELAAHGRVLPVPWQPISQKRDCARGCPLCAASKI